MYVRRKVFSWAIDPWDGEEKLFSTKKVESRHKRGEKHEISLEDVGSHRGLGRSIVLGAGLPGAVGAGLTKGYADDLDRKGYDDHEIVRKAGHRGAALGAGAGLIAGGAAGLGYSKFIKSGINNLRDFRIISEDLAKKGHKNRRIHGAGIAAAGIGLGALGAYLGARKNAKSRTDKRRIMESKIRDRR